MVKKHAVTRPPPEVYVDEFVDVVGPSSRMLGPVADGGVIRTVGVEPACYGPMITPSVRSGHTVTRPVAVEGARVGDGIAIKLRKIRVLSRATASGTSTPVEGSFVSDPFVAKKCPGCGTVNPETYLRGTGENAVRCKKCDTPVSAFNITCMYSMLFDEGRTIGVTLPKRDAESIARDARTYAALPPKALTYPVLILGRGDMPGLVTRVTPFPGNVGTVPAVDMPSSHNCGDFGPFLVGAQHALSIKQENLADRTDSHMDIDTVKEGATVIAPVKVDGGGVFVGDFHAMQGDGEIALHTTDVTAECVLEVEVIKNLGNEGPVIIPKVEDLPPLAKPLTKEEISQSRRIAGKFKFDLEEKSAPVQVVGSGQNLNDAANNGLSRMAKLFGMSMDEVLNRVTLTGGVEIGRLPGLVHVTMRLPLEKLEKVGIGDLIRKQYFTRRGRKN